jgi:hypothetical protein
MLLRNANPSDFPQILKLNEESVNFLSPLTPVRLEHLHKEATYHRVLETDGKVAAFLLALREGCAYDSPNYRWFAENYDRFIYIDRIVVSVAYQGRGIGHRFYTDLFSFARQTNASRVTCEFDIDPPNDLSRRFHERHGFKEVGTQSVASGKKQVSLRALSLQIGHSSGAPPRP